MIKLKLTRIGNSIGLVLPKEALGHLRVDKGDSLFLVETADGYVMTPYDPEFGEAMEIAREGAKKYRNALRELSK